MKMFRKEEGFTLIELMVVVLIIGILVAIAIPVFNGARANAQRRSCYANERTLEGAAHAYEASMGAVPGAGFNTLTGALVPAYVASVPKCPAAGTYTWDGTYVTCANAGGVASDHGHF